MCDIKKKDMAMEYIGKIIDEVFEEKVIDVEALKTAVANELSLIGLTGFFANGIEEALFSALKSCKILPEEEETEAPVEEAPATV